MAQTALPAPRSASQRRVLFGLFAQDGWPWAIAKGLFWFVLMILTLGYAPDRAYYFTVQNTVDLGLLAWSPINFCPPANETLPCPAPQGATLPWHPAPEQLLLPGARTDVAAGQLGQTFLVTGGSDGSKAVADTFLAKAVGSGNFDSWTQGPALPEARVDAAYVTAGNTMFVLGGYGPDGKPTTTVYRLTVENDGTIRDWATDDSIALPEARAGASAVTVSDGLVVMGGVDASGAPTRSVWKNQQDANGKLGKWVEQSPLIEENVDGYAAHVGDVIFLIGGRNASGNPVATVQQGLVGGPGTTSTDPNQILALWRASAQTNLPVARTNMSGFTANGALYVQGGNDGTAQTSEAYWTTPDSSGVIHEWLHLDQTDLPQGVEGSAGVVSGPYAFLFGGELASGPTNTPARAYLAPMTPFFQLGILGATVPGLALGGEVGQQIGYMNAAGVGTVDFILFILLGWAFANKAKVRAMVAERRRRREAKV